MAQNIPIYRISANNVNSALNQLSVSEEIKTDIKNAVNAKKIVYVPKTELQIEDWRGSGYTIIDPETGAGTYMISGGIAGGVVVKWTFTRDCIKSIFSYIIELLSAWFRNSNLISFIGLLDDLKSFRDNVLTGSNNLLSDLLLFISMLEVTVGYFSAIAAVAFISPEGLVLFGVSAILVIINYLWLGQGDELVKDCTKLITQTCEDEIACTLDFHGPTGECQHISHPEYAIPEICGDYFDNDCDGVIDERCNY